MGLPFCVQIPETLGDIGRCHGVLLAVCAWCSRNKAIDDHFADMDTTRCQCVRQNTGSFVLCGYADGQRTIAGCKGIDLRLVQRHDAAGSQHGALMRLQIGETRLHGSDIACHPQIEAVAQIGRRYGKQIALDIKKGIPMQDANGSPFFTNLRHNTPHCRNIAQIGWKGPRLNAFFCQLLHRRC